MKQKRVWTHRETSQKWRHLLYFETPLNNDRSTDNLRCFKLKMHWRNSCTHSWMRFDDNKYFLLDKSTPKHWNTRANTHTHVESLYTEGDNRKTEIMFFFFFICFDGIFTSLHTCIELNCLLVFLSKLDLRVFCFFAHSQFGWKICARRACTHALTLRQTHTHAHARTISNK